MWHSLILSYDSLIEPRQVSENIPKINSVVKHLRVLKNLKLHIPKNLILNVKLTTYLERDTGRNIFIISK